MSESPLSRREFVAGSLATTVLAGMQVSSQAAADAEGRRYRLFWGDLHNHNEVGYGVGSLQRSIDNARAHLDFFAFTGHASWHDEPEDDVRWDMHARGFEKLSRGWGEVQRLVESYNDPGRFVTILSHEWHSVAYGDHNVYFPDTTRPIVYADDLASLHDQVRKIPGAILIAHMLGYAPGMRGVNWDALDPEVTPLVEIYSAHGSCESDTAPYPYYNEIGPRDHRSTLQAGLRMGKKVGVVASTDFHGGYPGNYDQGLTGVYAERLDRGSLFDAFRRRRTFAVTGDRIELDFRVNDAPMGEILGPSRQRRLHARIRGWDRLDRVELLKNGRPLERWCPPWPSHSSTAPRRYVVRVEWGWGWRHESSPTAWRGSARVDGGRLGRLCPCFRVSPDISPSKTADGDLPPYDNAILEQTEAVVAWKSTTMPNRYVRVGATSALVMEIEADTVESCRITLELNGCRTVYSISELLEGSYAHSSNGKLRGPSFRIHGAVAEHQYTQDLFLTDETGSGEDAGEPADGYDDYMVRVRQENGQWAWSSPIWVARD